MKASFPVPSMSRRAIRIWLAPLALLIVGITIAYWLAAVKYDGEAAQNRDSVRAALEPVRGQLGRELFGAIHLTEGLAGTIAIDGRMSSTRFAAIASELLRRSDLIRHIALAPDNVVTLVYPLEGNESVLGFDYAKNVQQWPSIARMMAEERLIVAGPVKLVQGGTGIIGRTPIYVRAPEEGDDARRYWGLASTVVDFDLLLRKTTLADVSTRLDVAMRGLDGLSESGPEFWGTPSVFAASPVIVDVPLPSGTWQLAAVPRGGWRAFSAVRSNYFRVGVLGSLLLAALLFKLLEHGENRKLEVLERRRAERVLLRANRALRLFSRVKGAVVRAADEDGMLNEVCRIAVESAGYPLAWVGRAETDERKTVRPVAGAGETDGILDKIFVSWADDEFGRGAGGTAIRTRAPTVVRDLPRHERYSPWHDVVTEHDASSAIGIPLIVQGDVFGVLLIYARELDAFDDTEVGLLEDLGDTISFGMESLAARRERADAMCALERAHEELEERVQQRTQELLIAKEAAESADRIKSAFLATMSHELRTPLNSIIGFTGILVQGLAGDLNAEQKKQLGMVQSSAQHLLALINDVLDLSKIEAGQLTLAHDRFDLRELVSRALGTIRPMADRKGVHLETQVDPTVGDFLGDRRRVEQVLLNLLSNAVKFTESGEVSVHVTRMPGAIQVAVRDTGIGIPSVHRRSLFEPFFQIDSGIARRHEGSGLGLSICRRLVELMGGTIEVSSTPGEGSVFTFTVALEQVSP